MKKRRLLFTILAGLFLFSSDLIAQKAPIKFGKIDMSDLEMRRYEKDTGAHAMILCDYGILQMDYETTKGEFFYLYTRHVRFKIFDKSGYDWADFPIYLSRNGSDKDNLYKFKAATYNLENGKIVSTELKKKEVMMEESSESWTIAKVAMPEIKEGSVFEISYTIRSPFYWNLEDWQFQYSIPVAYTEYRMEYPEWFQYNHSYKGYDLGALTVNDESRSAGSINFTGFSRTEGYNVQSRSNSSSLDYQNFTYRWVAEDMPAFKPEAYISSVDNYLTSVKFELASVRLPNSTTTNYTKSWDDISRTLMDSDYFGLTLGKLKTKFLEKPVQDLVAGMEGEMEKIGAIYYHLRDKMVWTGQERVFSSSVSLKKTYQAGKGNSADINLNLTAALRWAGLSAYPVILSTRENGFINPAYASISQCNYVIVAVALEGDQIILLDATERALPFHLLPSRCINGQGQLITKDGAMAINLRPSGKFKKASQFKLALNEEGDWVGKLTISRKDYATRSLRTEVAQDGETVYIEKFQNDHESVSIDGYEFEHLQNLGNETKEHYEIRISDQVMEAGDLLYFNPILLFGETENPFKLEERKYPVDYNYPLEYVHSAQFEIPEGYVVEEVPENAVVSLPGKGGRFVYSISVQDKLINFTNQIKISKHLYLPEEYPHLKEFYNMIIEKHGAQIVLKKKT